MLRPRRSLPHSLPTRAPDEEPTISGEYQSVAPRGPAAAPPSGRYGTAPESRRVLDEYDFDIHTWDALELEDDRRRRSHEPLPPASFTPRVASSPRPTTSGAMAVVRPSARRAIGTGLLVASVVLAAAFLAVAVGFVIALVSAG